MWPSGGYKLGSNRIIRAIFDCSTDDALLTSQFGQKKKHLEFLPSLARVILRRLLRQSSLKTRTQFREFEAEAP